MASIETIDIAAQFKMVIKHWQRHHHNVIDMFTVVLLHRLLERDMWHRNHVMVHHRPA